MNETTIRPRGASPENRRRAFHEMQEPHEFSACSCGAKAEHCSVCTGPRGGHWTEAEMREGFGR